GLDVVLVGVDGVAGLVAVLALVVFTNADVVVVLPEGGADPQRLAGVRRGPARAATAVLDVGDVGGHRAGVGRHRRPELVRQVRPVAAADVGLEPLPRRVVAGELDVALATVRVGVEPAWTD